MLSAAHARLNTRAVALTIAEVRAPVQILSVGSAWEVTQLYAARAPVKWLPTTTTTTITTTTTTTTTMMVEPIVTTAIGTRIATALTVAAIPTMTKAPLLLHLRHHQTSTCTQLAPVLSYMS